jgi:hypothetical protein
MARLTVTQAQLSRRANAFAVKAIVGHLGHIHNNMNNAIQPTQPQHFLSRCEVPDFACIFATCCLNCVDLLR